MAIARPFIETKTLTAFYNTIPVRERLQETALGPKAMEEQTKSMLQEQGPPGEICLIVLE